MSDAAVEAARWEFVVWSEEGQGRYSVCLHRGDLGSPDHLCLGEAVSKTSAEHAVHHANEWLIAHTADLTARLASAEADMDTFQQQNRAWIRENTALKAAVEQAHMLMERAADALDHIAQYSISGNVYESLRHSLRAALTSGGGRAT